MDVAELCQSQILQIPFVQKKRIIDATFWLLVMWMKHH